MLGTKISRRRFQHLLKYIKFYLSGERLQAHQHRFGYIFKIELNFIEKKQSLSFSRKLIIY